MVGFVVVTDAVITDDNDYIDISSSLPIVFASQMRLHACCFPVALLRGMAEESGQDEMHVAVVSLACGLRYCIV